MVTVMDNFMDKIAQKLNSQEIISANAAADAAEMESLEKQLDKFIWINLWKISNLHDATPFRPQSL